MMFKDFIYYLGFDIVPTNLHEELKVAATSNPNFELCLDAVLKFIDEKNRQLEKSEVYICSCAFFIVDGVCHNQFIIQRIKR